MALAPRAAGAVILSLCSALAVKHPPRARLLTVRPRIAIQLRFAADAAVASARPALLKLLRLPETAMVDAAAPNPSIRRATESDAPELAPLMTALGHPTTAKELAERWTRWAAAGNAALVAVLRDDALAGVVTLHQMTVLHRPRPVGRITALVVDAAVRGQGFGRALVSAAERALSEAGCGLLEITSNVKWTEAHAFYAHLEYGQTSVRFAKILESAR